MFDNLEPRACHKLVSEDGWTYIDVRTPDEFSAGHPVGAQNIPFALIGPGGMMPNPMFLQVMGALYSKDSKLVVEGPREG